MRRRRMRRRSRRRRRRRRKRSRRKRRRRRRRRFLNVFSLFADLIFRVPISYRTCCLYDRLSTLSSLFYENRSQNISFSCGVAPSLYI
jgi:hypothetical protein